MRILDWQGVGNLRDLGGLSTPLSSTGSTAFGRVARGPRRESLTQRGWDAASAWGLRSIVDLRNPDEAGAREGDPDAAPATDIAIRVTPTDNRTNAEFIEVCLPILGSPEYWQHNVRILPELVREALEAIASAEPGILVHCSAGRDRTGMVSALLLANAGVSADDIAKDYAESVRAMAGARLRGVLSEDWQASWSADQAEGWLKEAQPHVREFIADPDAVFDRLDITESTRRRLRELLVD